MPKSRARASSGTRAARSPSAMGPSTTRAVISGTASWASVASSAPTKVSAISPAYGRANGSSSVRDERRPRAGVGAAGGSVSMTQPRLGRGTDRSDRVSVRRPGRSAVATDAEDDVLPRRDARAGILRLAVLGTEDHGVVLGDL